MFKTSIKVWLASLLRKCAEWLDPIPIENPDPKFQEVLARTRTLVLEHENTPHTGSYKRAQVMKTLIVEFKGVRKRLMSQAIELALQDLN